MAIYLKNGEYRIVRGPDSAKGMRKCPNEYGISRVLQEAIFRLVNQGELTTDGELTDIGRSNAAIVGQLCHHDSPLPWST